MIFGDFPIKSSLSVFNFWRQKTSFLVFLTFQELRDSELSKLKAQVPIFGWGWFWAKVGHQGATRGPKRGLAPIPPRRATWCVGPSGGRLAPSFILTAAYREKTYAIFFQKLSRRRRRRRSSPTPGDGRSCCSEASGEGEIQAIITSTPPRRGRRHLHHHLHQHHHHLHHHLRDPLHPPS